MLDAGRVADIGTHEELTERCPLYRQLITGPDDDEDLAAQLSAGARPGGGTHWRRRASDAGRPRAVRRAARRRGGRAGAGAGNSAGCSRACRPRPSCWPRWRRCRRPRTCPDVDISQARAADRHFTLRRLLQPLAFALIIGLLLDGLDAVAGLALPALVRERHRPRHADQGLPRDRGGLPDRAGHRAGRLGGQHRRDDGGRPQRRTAAVHPAGQAVRPAAAARPGLLRARAVRPDHDQDDHRRGRAVQLPADRR